MSLLVYNWWQWNRRWRPVEIVEVEFDLASDLSSNVHPCHLKGNTTVLADTKNKQNGYLLHSIIRVSKGYALSPECDVYVSRLAGLETLSYSWSRPCQLHLKKAVAVDENPSHAIELQAPHLVSNIPNKGTTELRTEWFCQSNCPNN